MRAVTVVGGGFSGLATAYYLSQRGNPRRDPREDRSARRPDRDARDATRSRRDRGNGDEELGARRRRVPGPRASDAVLHPVVQPGSLHLPPATQAVAVEPGRVARRSRRGSRRRPRGARGAPGRSRPSTSGVRVCWDAGRPGGSSVQPSRACTPAILRASSASLRVWRGERAAPPARKGVVAPARGMQQLIDAPGVPPAGARREHPPEYPCTAGWLDARGHLHIGARCGGMPPGRCTGRQPGAVDDRHAPPGPHHGLLPRGGARRSGAAGSCFRVVETSARSACCSTRTSFPTAQGSTPRAGFTEALRIVTSCTSPRTIWRR